MRRVPARLFHASRRALAVLVPQIIAPIALFTFRMFVGFSSLMGVQPVSLSLHILFGPSASSVLLAKAGAGWISGAGVALSFVWLGIAPRTRGHILAAWAFWSLVTFAWALRSETEAHGLTAWNQGAVLSALVPAAWVAWHRRPGAVDPGAGGARA